MTIPAHLFGHEYGNYLFYDLITGAIPIFELMGSYKEIHNLVASEDDLRALLCKNFRVYIQVCNKDRGAGQALITAEKEYQNALDYFNFPHK